MNPTSYSSAARTLEEPTFGEEVTEFLPWVFGAVLVVPAALLSMVLWAPALLMLVLVAAPFVALTALAALAAILVAPFLLIRDLYRHIAGRRSAKRSRPTPVAPAREVVQL